jgi:SAM-dependent methyltransferase
MWHGLPVPAYEHFAAFYDAVMDDPAPRAARVIRCIDDYLPKASSLLELGCGTGAILAHLTSVPMLTGLDRSPEMLHLARAKVPDAQLIEGDMQSFALDERFDVVICVFDSLNHLLTFEAWRTVFNTVHDHLMDGGLFIFDVNTVGELRRLGEEPPWVYDFDGGVAIMDVAFADDGQSEAVSQWEVRIFEDMGSSRYRLHHEVIGELGVPLDRITAALEDCFTLLEQFDEHDRTPTDESMKAYFCLRRGP